MRCLCSVKSLGMVFLLLVESTLVGSTAQAQTQVQVLVLSDRLQVDWFLHSIV